MAARQLSVRLWKLGARTWINPLSIVSIRHQESQNSPKYTIVTGAVRHIYGTSSGTWSVAEHQDPFADRITIGKNEDPEAYKHLSEYLAECERLWAR